jgi:thioredoxin 1
MVNNLTTEDFEEKVIKAKKPVIVKMYTKSCVPCKLFSPIYKELSEENGHIDFYQLDAEEEHAIATEYDLMVVPTVMFFYKGEYLDRFSGMLNKEKVLSLFEELVIESFEKPFGRSEEHSIGI